MTSTKTELPPPVPGRDEPLEELLSWVNTAAAREHNPLVAVRRYGFQLDARIVLTFANGDYVRVRHRDLMGANGLRHVLMAYDGSGLPDYGQAGCSAIVSRIIWAAEASIHDDELDAFLADVGNFLRRSLLHGVIRRNYRDNGYAVIADLAAVNAHSDGTHNTQPPALALDTSSDPPVLWVPRGPLIAYLRDVRAKIDQSDVRGLLEALGWQWANFQRRRPGAGEHRPLARVWVVPVAWELCPFDLPAAVEQAPEARE